MGSALNVLSSLVIVLGILVVALYVSKRFLKNEHLGSKGKIVRVLSSTYIGMKKSISLVEIPGSILVLGLSNDNITLLSKIEDKDTQEIVKGSDSTKPVRPAWSEFKMFSSPARGNEPESSPPHVFSLVKGKILDLTKYRRLRIRSVQLHAVPVGKDKYE
jgi:flagellar biosynthetic protein FliO